MKRRWARIGLWLCVAGIAAVAGVFFAWHTLSRKMPRGMTKDIHAGMAARNIQDPDQRLEKYLEVRFGDLKDPAHRQEVFTSFFEVDRIKTLQWLVQHAPKEKRQDSIDAMARWIAGYRSSLSPEERAELNARFQTADGRAMLRRATAAYNSQDVTYRGNTAPVISELLRTLNEVQQAP